MVLAAQVAAGEMAPSGDHLGRHPPPHRYLDKISAPAGRRSKAGAHLALFVPAEVAHGKLFEELVVRPLRELVLPIELALVGVADESAESKDERYP